MESPVPNPYSTPSANLYGAATGAGADAVSPGTIAALAGTKPWVRFMSVMVWIGVVFMLLGGLGMLVMGMLGLNGGPSSSQMGMPGPGGAFMVGMAGAYVFMAFMYIYPAIKLWKYASHIGRLSSSRTVADLDEALNEQRRFWKFLGIAMIVLMSLYAVFIIGMIAVVGMGAYSAAANH